MKLMKKLGMALAACLILSTSCKDDNYYTVEVVQPETPDTPPAEEPEDPIDYVNPVVEIRNLDYYIGTKDLNPAYLLQARGLAQLFNASPFVQDKVTDRLLISVQMPEQPVTVTLEAEESELAGPFEARIDLSKVEGVKAGDTVYYRLPVNWKYKELASWEKSRNVEMGWNVKVNGQKVKSYIYKVTCRSIHDFSFWTEWEDNSGGSDEWFDSEMNRMGGYPAWRLKKEDRNSLFVSNTYMLAGFIDEHSPLIDHMKQEVMTDGYVDNIYGPESYTTDEECIATVEAFAYLMQKYHVKYAQRNSNDRPYIRTIDEVFSLGQGYYTELSCAFASWCINIGLPVYFVSMPNHIYPCVLLPSGKMYPWDPALLHHYDYPDLKQPGEEAFARAHENFLKVEESSAEYLKEDLTHIEAGDLMFQTTNLYMARLYMPSLNLSDNYWSNAISRSADGQELQPITDPALLKRLKSPLKAVEATVAGETAIR